MRHNGKAGQAHSRRRSRVTGWRCRQLAGPSVLVSIWPAPKPQYAVARRVGVGQARRWSTLSELSRLKQERFTN